MALTQTSIREDILDLSGDGPRLIGMRCLDCDNYVFPYQDGCNRCTGTNVERVQLGTKGTLWAWTIQGFPPKAPPFLGEADPKLFKPYGVGYVEIEGQLKVEARLTEADPEKLKVGMPMELTTVTLCEDDGSDLVTFAFAPCS
jgi:uncharacterized OB-fold protein